MQIEVWETQLRKGAVELAVLGVLAKGDSYGVAILERLAEVSALGVAEGSIYPLLHRLQKDGKVASRWVEEPGASHPRKYYALTPQGREMLTKMQAGWRRLRSGLDAILCEES